MSKKGPPIYSRGKYWLDWDYNAKGEVRRPYLTIFWYDPGSQRIRSSSTGTKEEADAIAILDDRWLKDNTESISFCPTCGRPMADAKQYLLTDAIADYRLEKGDAKPSADSIIARLNHVLDHLEATDKLSTTCAIAATDSFVITFREWSQLQPVVWRNKAGAITVSKPRSLAATEEAVNQLRAVLNYAVLKERSDAKPAFKGYSRASVSQPIMTRIDVSCMAEMVAYAAEDKKRRGSLHSFIIASLCTVARPDAVVDIGVQTERNQWRPGATTLNLNQKGRRQTKKHRAILPVLPILGEWLQATYDDPATEWLVNYYGEPVQDVDRSWKAMLKALGLPVDREHMPYVLRRSLAAELRNRHVDPWDLEGYMGHRVVRTSEIYTGEGLYATVSKALCDILADIEAKAGNVLHRTSTAPLALAAE